MYRRKRKSTFFRGFKNVVLANRLVTRNAIKSDNNRILSLQNFVFPARFFFQRPRITFIGCNRNDISGRLKKISRLISIDRSFELTTFFLSSIDSVPNGRVDRHDHSEQFGTIRNARTQIWRRPANFF